MLLALLREIGIPVSLICLGIDWQMTDDVLHTGCASVHYATCDKIEETLEVLIAGFLLSFTRSSLRSYMEDPDTEY